MAPTLLVASLGPGEGKTAFCAALALRWGRAGKRVQYLKPADLEGVTDGGYLFARKVLGLGEPPQKDGPISINPQSPPNEAAKRIKEACHEAAQQIDVFLVEAPGGVSGNEELARAIAQAIEARVALVVRYSREVPKEWVLSAAQTFGDSLVGVLLNAVPELSRRIAREEVVPFLQEAGVSVLGLLPESRKMLGITVSELVEKLGGRFALTFDSADEIVENIMVGANVLDAPGYPAAPLYYGLRDKKVVIAKGDRPDFHWGAIDTPTYCVILTGKQEPIPYVVEKAKERKVPLAVVERDTIDVLDALDEILAISHFNQMEKLNHYLGLLEEQAALPSVEDALKI